MIVPIKSCGAVGLVIDTLPGLAPVNAWTAAVNVGFIDGSATRLVGYEQIFLNDLPTVDFYYMLAARSPTTSYWFFGGQEEIYLQSSDTWLDVTRQTLGSPVLYDTNARPIWTGGVLGGIPILNHDKMSSADPPQSWTGTLFQDLPNWPAGVHARVVRPYLQYLVALDIMDISEYPTLVMWSESAAAGTIPASWVAPSATATPGKDHGNATLSDTTSAVVDCFPLGSANIVYKEDSAYAMQWTGGSETFRFTRIFDKFGMLAQNCCATVDNQHIVLSRDDVILHNGSTFRSIADKRVRRRLFNKISADNYKYCFVEANIPQKEVWICIPHDDQSGRVTEAFIWNYRDDTWTTRELPAIVHMAAGIVELEADSDTFDGVPAGIPFNADTGIFDQQRYNPSQTRSIMLSNDPTLSSSTVYKIDETGVADVYAHTSLLLREGLNFDGYMSVSDVKFVRAIYPEVVGEGTLLFYIGTQNKANDSITWYGPKTFVIGTDRKVDFTASGMIISLRITSTTGNWRIMNLLMDVDKVSLY